MKGSEQLNELGVALAKAQGEIKDAIRDSANPFYHSKYADLASVWEVCRGPLSKNGLSVIQSVSSDDNNSWLETMLLHSSGQYVSEIMKLKIKDDTMQGLGSAITYARRYQLSAFVGVAPDDDDDGNAASGKKVEKPIEKPAQPAKPETVPTEDIKAALVKTEARVKIDEDIKAGMRKLEIPQTEWQVTFNQWGFKREPKQPYTDEQAAAILKKINELVALK